MTGKQKFDAVMKAALADDACKFKLDESILTGIKAKVKEQYLSTHLQIHHGISDNKQGTKCMKEEYIIINGRYNMFKLGKRKALVLTLVAILTILILGSAIGAGAANKYITDKIDYPFKDDPQVIGKWQSVDFVRNIEDFKPGEISWKSDLYLKELAFVKGGKMLISFYAGNGNLTASPVTWTKGLLLSPVDKTASKYEIIEMDGNEYMFMEWKSGDYTFRGMKPYYYVLMKSDSENYADYEALRKAIIRKVDKIDYDFVPDPEVVGKWESVDFVETKDVFNPEKRQCLMDLYLKSMDFDENGKMTFDTGYSITWTKGHVLHPGNQTASKYEIKEMNDSTYLFFQWKSGDYTLRGMEPKYYVLKKVE